MLSLRLLLSLFFTLHPSNSSTTSPSKPPIPSNGSLSPAVQEAMAFERSNWAAGSVLTDPFYTTLPSNASTSPFGSLLKLEANIHPENYTLPMGSTLSRIIYQSARLNGASVPTSAYILWPYISMKRPDNKIPLVAYAHGTTGTEPDCAPSHERNFYQHYLAPYPLAHAGYAVVAPDYAGLGVSRDAKGRPIVHEYFASPAGANDLIAAVQAAQSAFPELTKEFVVMGHSQGGGVAWAAAQRQAEDPVEGYLGTVAVAPVNKYIPTKEYFFKAPAATYSLLQIVSRVPSLFPGFDLGKVVTDAGMETLRILKQTGGCGSVLMTAANPNVSAVVGDTLQNAQVEEYFNRSATGGKKIGTPMYIVQGIMDRAVPVTTTELAVNETVEKLPESRIQFEMWDGLDHYPSLEATQIAWLSWIGDRFKGVEVPKYKEGKVVKPVRPVEFIQKELNFFLNFATKPFQVA